MTKENDLATVDHTHHRQRLYAQVENTGLDKMSEYGAMEFILTYVLPRVDTNPVAHRLIDAFGNIASVLDASKEELQNIKGMGKNASRLLVLLPQIFARYTLDKQKFKTTLTDKRSSINYCKMCLSNKSKEELYAICLNKNWKVLNCIFMAKGEVNELVLNTQEFLRKVVTIPNVNYVILTHSHPSGNPKASNVDEATTQKCDTLLRAVGIQLIEHIIIGENQAYCVKEGNFYDL